MGTQFIYMLFLTIPLTTEQHYRADLGWNPFWEQKQGNDGREKLPESKKESSGGSRAPRGKAAALRLARNIVMSLKNTGSILAVMRFATTTCGADLRWEVIAGNNELDWCNFLGENDSVCSTDALIKSAMRLYYWCWLSPASLSLLLMLGLVIWTKLKSWDTFDQSANTQYPINNIKSP